MQEGKEQVRQRAYALWEEEGRPEGREQDHWQRAEEELGQDGKQEGEGLATDGAYDELSAAGGGLASGLQPGGTTPGGGAGAGAGSLGTGGGSTGDSVSGSRKH
jgi:hypothetical protein